jgi:lipopolysaccharide exporter
MNRIADNRIDQEERRAERATGDPSGVSGLRGIRRSAIRGTSWITAARVVAAIGVIGRYIWFARLLTPRDFGVIGADTFLGILLLTATNPNFDRALVPTAESVEEHLDTVWAANLAQGMFVMFVTILLAHPVARFFHIEDSYTVFWYGAPMALVGALRSPASSARIDRELNFRISLVLNVAEQSAAFVIGLIAVLWFRDWRGLVAAMYAGHIARATLTHWYFPYRPRLRFDRARAWKLFSYGKWITVRALADFASRNLDTLLVGHLLGGPALGEYQIAFRLGEMPSAEVAGSVGGVAFPLVSRVNGESGERERVFWMTSGIVALVGICYAIFIFNLGYTLITMTVGPQWLGALPPLKILCVYGLGRALLNVGGSILEGLNAPGLSFRLNLLVLMVLSILIYPMTAAGATAGAACAEAISVLIVLPLMFRFYRRASKAFSLEPVQLRPECT